MSMIVTRGFNLERNEQTQECLRCGYVEQPAVLAVHPRAAEFTDADKARRFRDKAAEADQLADLAQTKSRRETLIQISNNYIRTAQQMEQLSKYGGHEKR